VVASDYLDWTCNYGCVGIRRSTRAFAEIVTQLVTQSPYLASIPGLELMTLKRQDKISICAALSADSSWRGKPHCPVDFDVISRAAIETGPYPANKSIAGEVIIDGRAPWQAVCRIEA
jgi:hypothetical protein